MLNLCWFIWSQSTWGATFFHVSPSILYNKGEASYTFQELRGSTITHSRRTAVFSLVNNDTLDTTINVMTFIIDKLEANKLGKEPDKTSFKRPKLAHLERVEADNVDTVRWAIVE